MRRTKAQEMRRLQKKLIPVNLLVCILCIVASLSLFFMPIVKINLANIVGDKTLRQIVTDIAVAKVNAFIEQAGDSIDGSLGGGSENGSESGGEDGSGSEVPNENPDGNGGEGGAVTARAKLTAEGEASGESTGETGGSEGTGSDGGSGESGGMGSEGEGSGNEGNEGSGGEDGNNDVTIKDLLKEVDVTELITRLVDEIFNELKADISVSSRNSLTVFRAKDKADTLLNELFFNEANGFITNLEKTLVTGFGNAFNAAGKLVQGAVVKAVVVPALKENLPKEYADLVVAEELQTTIDSLDNAKSAQEASDTIINYIDGLSEKSEDIDQLTPEQKADISKQITELYDKTVAETGEGNFTVEAMITVMASEMLGGVGDFNLSDIIAGFAGGGNGGGNGGDTQNPENPEIPENPEEKPEADIVKFLMLSKLALAEGEPAEGGSAETGGEGSGNEGGSGETGGETGGEDKEIVKYTTYRDMGEGLAKGFIGDDLEGSLKSAIKSAVGGNEAVFGYYGYIFIGVGFFIILWLILFLFAFFHMFARNKRFVMWYVKLFCAWPCIIFYIVPLLVKKVLAVAFPEIYTQVIETIAQFIGNAANVTVTTQQAADIMNAVLSSFQTFAWISGICYLLLWIISICWAFPIKHKIRKLKKSN